MMRDEHLGSLKVRYMQALNPPPNVTTDPQSLEIARIWIAHGGQHFTMRTEVWDDPAAWGIMLVDLANHIANAYEQLGADDRTAILARIKAGFDAEWGSPTDSAQGHVE